MPTPATYLRNGIASRSADRLPSTAASVRVAGEAHRAWHGSRRTLAVIGLVLMLASGCSSRPSAAPSASVSAPTSTSADAGSASSSDDDWAAHADAAAPGATVAIDAGAGSKAAGRVAVLGPLPDVDPPPTAGPVIREPGGDETIPPRTCQKGERPAQEYHGMTCYEHPAAGPPTKEPDRFLAFAVINSVDLASCPLGNMRPVASAIDITVRRDGTIKDVTLGRSFEGTPRGACIAELYRKIRVRPFLKPETATFRKGFERAPGT